MPIWKTDDSGPGCSPELDPAGCCRPRPDVAAASPMLAVSTMTFSYGPTQPVFEGFTWHVARGEVCTILGPSACGKSTLLLLVAGLLRPQAGTIAVDGTPLSRPRPGTGLILQEYGLLPWATVRANIGLGLRIRRFYGPDGRHAPPGTRLPAEELGARVTRWLARLDLAGVADRYPGEISGGQRQRAAIARAMVMAPDLLLMDEPFSALDAPTREDLQRLTLRICAEANLTAVLVTHNLEEAAYVGQNILLLDAPPNRVAGVIPNPHETGEGYRRSTAYQGTCADLRRRIHSSRMTATPPLSREEEGCARIAPSRTEQG